MFHPKGKRESPSKKIKFPKTSTRLYRSALKINPPKFQIPQSPGVEYEGLRVAMGKLHPTSILELFFWIFLPKLLVLQHPVKILDPCLKSRGLKEMLLTLIVLIFFYDVNCSRGYFFYPQTGNQLFQERHNRFQ